MTGKTHQVIGLTCGLTTFLVLIPPHYNPATFAAVLTLSSLAALLPDIDQPAALIWQKLPFGHVVGEVINPFLEHRNLTHSLLGVGIVGYLFSLALHQVPAYWGWDTGPVWLSVMASYISHLLADMVTVQGIPLFFPWDRMFGIPPKPFEGIRILTGQWFENLIIFPVANATFVTIVITHWHLIQILLFR